MATKFTKLISSGNTTLVKRAEALSTKAKISQETIINNLKNLKSNLELQIFDMLDFAPESTDSLRPGSSNFNGDEWAETLQKAKVDLYKTELSLKIAQETYDEYFTETED